MLRQRYIRLVGLAIEWGAVCSGRANGLRADTSFIPPFHIEHELRGDFELLGGAFVALQHRYVAEQKRFDPATDLIPFAPPAYHLVELSIGLSHDLPNDAGDMSYTLHVENLLNQEYKEYTNLARYYSHDLGRNIRFSMIYHF